MSEKKLCLTPNDKVDLSNKFYLCSVGVDSFQLLKLFEKNPRRNILTLTIYNDLEWIPSSFECGQTDERAFLIFHVILAHFNGSQEKDFLTLIIHETLIVRKWRA